MNEDHNEVICLKSTLRSVHKSRLIKEEEVYRLRNSERTLMEEFNRTTNENNFLSEQLTVSQQSVSKAQHQLTLIDICLTSENSKITSHINSLQSFQQDFIKLFEQENYMNNLKNIQSEEQEVLKEKEKIQKRIETDTRNHHQFQEIVLIENECKDLEQECAVLKKRNTAIMLKLRRKLLETENTRKELTKAKIHTTDNKLTP